LKSNLNPSVFQQNVTFTAHVDNGTHTPTGSVTFYDGITSLGTFSLVGDSAQFSSANLTAGSHTIKVVYSGDSNFKSDSTSITQTVNQSSPVVTLKSSLNPSVFEQNVIFTAHVDNGTHTPTGSVTFYDGITSLGTFSLVGDSAVLATSALTVGVHQIKIVFSGDANFKSDSSSLVETILRRSTTTILRISPNPSTYGQTVTIRDSVSGPVPVGGTVQFYDGPAALGVPATFGITGVAGITVSALSAGTHIISAFYSGSAMDDSSRTAGVLQIVERAPIVHRLSTPQVHLIIGASATFTDSVVGTLPDGGTIQLKDGLNDIGSPVMPDAFGVVVMTIPGFTSGGHAITAYFSGTGNFLPGLSNKINISVSDSAMYRTFVPESIAYARDDRGRKDKYVLRKPVRVLFGTVLQHPALNSGGMHIEFGSPIDTAYSYYTVPASQWNRVNPQLTKWELLFSQQLQPTDSVTIFGYAKGARNQRISSYYWRSGGLKAGNAVKNPIIRINQPKLPMPNSLNAVLEAFTNGAFVSTNGLLVGKDRSADSAKFYGWLQARNVSDILKTLSDRFGMQSGYPRAFDYTTTIPSHPIVKRQWYIPPSKQNNVLLADVVALKINIAASALAITPVGFGELIYNDGTANPLNGEMVGTISHIADSMMMGSYNPVTHLHQFAFSPLFVNLAATIERINSAFNGKIDTLKFSDTLRFTGVRSIDEIPYLFPNPGVIPVRISPASTKLAEGLPDKYILYQNYPNPFNPRTTIGFNLPFLSRVTLRVYNTLGQEVATLIDGGTAMEGFNELEFDCSQLSTGVYFYRMVAEKVSDNGAPELGDSYTVTKKMMLVK
jgi:hypothetical protein